MNADARFKDFVARQHRAAPADDAIDWGRERDEWLGHLDGLYAFVAGVLEPFVRAGTVALQTSRIELVEEDIGVYTAEQLTVRIGSQEINLTPVGTLLVGSKGRVDVQGAAGVSRLLLVDRAAGSPLSTIRVTMIRPGETPPPDPPTRAAPDWTWKIVGRPPAMRFVDLTPDAFLDLLVDVSGG